jgi:hypothetical protein
MVFWRDPQLNSFIMSNMEQAMGILSSTHVRDAHMNSQPHKGWVEVISTCSEPYSEHGPVARDARPELNVSLASRK